MLFFIDLRSLSPKKFAFIALIVSCCVGNAQTSRVPTFRQPVDPAEADKNIHFNVEAIGNRAATIVDWKPKAFLPTILGLDKNSQNDEINSFFGTSSNLSYFGQVKSIYNGSSSSATVSADLASLNFGAGFQVTAGTNIQAGSSGATHVTSGTVPTLSSTSAGQATQNILYGGTIYVSALLPVLSYGAGTISKAKGGFGTSLNLIGREGVDIQNFKAGTSTDANLPPSHGSVQMEGYLQYNSINLAANQPDFAGAIFVGGSYGYSYTSHGYARDYGFGKNVNNGIGQVSVGILVTGVVKIAVSRAFGPSQTYIDSTSTLQTTVNNFASWSFGVNYQSPPAK